MKETAEKSNAKRSVKAVIFDLDGTLFDTEIYFFRAWTEAAASFGYVLSRKMALEMRSLGAPYAEEQFVEWFGEDCRFKEVKTLCGRLFDSISKENGVRLKPGAEELLKGLRERGLVIALATSGRTDRAGAYLKDAGIMRYFDRIACANMVERGKPAPDTYLEACRLLGIEPGEAFAVEDSPNGIRSAYRAGCRVIMTPDMSGPDGEVAPMLTACAYKLTDILSLADAM